MKHPLIRKHSFTLLEAMLSFCILAMILSFLFATLRSSATLSSKMDLARQSVFSHLHLKQRLDYIFSHIESCDYKAMQHNMELLYTEENSPSPSLHFIFDHGIDPEEVFTGAVQGTLRCENQVLYLDVSPIDNPSYIRREILYHGVSSIHLDFYKHPSPITSKERESSCSLEKLSSWSETGALLPSYIVLTLLCEDHTTLEYGFVLSSTIQPLHYEM